MQLSTLNTIATILIASATGVSSLVAIVLFAGSRASRDEVEKIVIRHVSPIRSSLEDLKSDLKRLQEYNDTQH